MGLVILYLTIALSLSFLCSILEAVLLSTPMSYISTKEKTHGKSAILLKKFKQDIDRPIAAILSLNTIAHTVGAAGVGAEAVKTFRNSRRNSGSSLNCSRCDRDRTFQKEKKKCR